jgi:hypothetical protein
MKLKKSGRQIPTFILGLLVVGLFVGITGLAMLSGSWKNSISKEEYLQRFKEVETPLYQHFQGRVSQ